MGMSKDEFMARYWKDKARKERQKELIANSYSCERSHRTSKSNYTKSKYKMTLSYSN